MYVKLVPEGTNAKALSQNLKETAVGQMQGDGVEGYICKWYNVGLAGESMSAPSQRLVSVGLPMMKKMIIALQSMAPDPQEIGPNDM